MQRNCSSKPLKLKATKPDSLVPKNKMINTHELRLRVQFLRPIYILCIFDPFHHMYSYFWHFNVITCHFQKRKSCSEEMKKYYSYLLNIGNDPFQGGFRSNSDPLLIICPQALSIPGPGQARANNGWALSTLVTKKSTCLSF